MAENEFNYVLNQSDIDALAEKLDAFSKNLTEKEQAALIGVFAAASAQIESEAEESEVQGFGFSPTMVQNFPAANTTVGTSFKSSLSRFTPGGIGGVGGNPLAGDSVGVTGTIMF